jgi:sigma-B regulation protein RsbU (phosphoserine phosphatase)
MATNVEELRRENARLQRAVGELSMLNDLARDLGASLDPDRIMAKIVRQAIKAVDASQGVVTLVNEAEHSSLKTLVRTSSPSGERQSFHLNESVLGWMLINRRPLLLNDPRSDSRFTGVRWDDSVSTLLAAPLMVKSRLIGVLAVYNKRGGNTFTDDDQRLLAIIAAQSAQIVENTRLYEEEQTLTRMREELRLANEIQTGLQLKDYPDIPGYDVHGISEPARSVGGDYIDFFPIPDDRYMLCVGDVSGKGLPASLLMANVQATLRSQAAWSASAAECVTRANALLCDSIRRGNFVTLFYAVLDHGGHSLEFANAGHNRPFVVKRDGSSRTLELGGLVLGVVKTFDYSQDVFALELGDVLCVYSDGIPEAMNLQRQQFGEDRLLELLAEHRDEPAKTIAEAVLTAVHEFAGQAQQHDDITLLIVKRVA